MSIRDEDDPTVGVHFATTQDDQDVRRKLKESFEGFLLKCGRRVVINGMDLSPGCPSGENFVAEITRVVVRGFAYGEDGDVEDYTESFIVKRIPGPESVNHKFFNCRSMFNNEVAGYEVVIQSFDHFANGKKFEKNWKRTCFAKYYGKAYDFIALEDLRPKGYQMGNRVQGFNVQECLLVLEKLSFFHALSFSVKSEDREKFAGIAAHLRETVFCEEMARGVVGVYWENAIRFALRSLTRREPRPGRAVQALTSYLDAGFRGLVNFIKPEEPFDIICHGDLWSNNILLRYVDGEVLDIKMIDLQTMRHGSCVLDLMHLLFTSLETDLLKTNFNEIISIYHSYLVLHMKGFDAEPEFTIDELKREFRRRVPYGLWVACLMFTFVTKDRTEGSEDIVPTKEELSAEDGIEREYLSLNDLYHERLYKLVTSLTELDLI